MMTASGSFSALTAKHWPMSEGGPSMHLTPVILPILSSSCPLGLAAWASPLHLQTRLFYSTRIGILKMICRFVSGSQGGLMLVDCGSGGIASPCHV